MMDDLTECVARAAYIAHHKNGPTEGAFDAPNMGRGGFKTEVIVWNAVAQAALAAIREAGFAVVPREPSEAMVRAAAFRFDRSLTESTAPEIVYRAMIEAGEVTLAPDSKPESTQG